MWDGRAGSPRVKRRVWLIFSFLFGIDEAGGMWERGEGVEAGG